MSWIDAVQTHRLTATAFGLDDDADPHLPTALADQAQLQIASWPVCMASAIAARTVVRSGSRIVELTPFARRAASRPADRGWRRRHQSRRPVAVSTSNSQPPTSAVVCMSPSRASRRTRSRDVAERDHHGGRAGFRGNGDDAVFDRPSLAILAPQQRTDTLHDVGRVPDLADDPARVLVRVVDQHLVVETQQLRRIVLSMRGGGRVGVTHPPGAIELQQSLAGSFDDLLVAVVAAAQPPAASALISRNWPRSRRITTRAHPAQQDGRGDSRENRRLKQLLQETHRAARSSRP